MAVFLDKQLPNWGACAGAVLAAFGLLISLEGVFLPGKGDLLVLCCSVFFALQILAVREASKTMNAMNAQDLTLIQVGVVSLCLRNLGRLRWKQHQLDTCCSLPGGRGERFWPKSSINWTSAVLWALAFTSVFANALAFLSQSWAQHFTGADRVALLLATEPVFAGLFSYLYGCEVFSLQKLLGCALIFAGILLSELTGTNFIGLLSPGLLVTVTLINQACQNEMWEVGKEVGSRSSEIGKIDSSVAWKQTARISNPLTDLNKVIKLVWPHG